MTDFSKACLEANKEVFTLLIKNFQASLLEKCSVGAGGDISMQADLQAEEIFVKHLGRFGAIESEESGTIGSGSRSIIIDPLDGSSNFASGFPYYGTSVAMLDEEGMLESAQVCNLINGEVFIKERNEELRMDSIFGNNPSVSGNTLSPEIGLFEKAYSNPAIAASLQEAGYRFRSPGATALSLAYAHTTNFFLFVGKSRIYDIVAGLSLCEGLEVIVDEDYVIVSQEKSIAKNIEIIVRRSLV